MSALFHPLATGTSVWSVEGGRSFYTIVLDGSFAPLGAVRPLVVRSPSRCHARRSVRSSVRCLCSVSVSRLCGRPHARLFVWSSVRCLCRCLCSVRVRHRCGRPAHTAICAVIRMVSGIKKTNGIRVFPYNNSAHCTFLQFHNTWLTTHQLKARTGV